MDDCIFCKIIRGEIPSTKVYEDDYMLIFKDIEPKAKNHFLCIPKSHFKLLSEMDECQSEMLLKCLKQQSSAHDQYPHRYYSCDSYSR